MLRKLQNFSHDYNQTLCEREAKTKQYNKVISNNEFQQICISL